MTTHEPKAGDAPGGAAGGLQIPLRVRMTADQKRALGSSVGLLRRLGLHDDVALATGPVTVAPPAPSVVVVGEVKRGKSTLVNALTGADVSPTAAEVITTGVIAVVPPDDDLPEGTARVEHADGSRQDAPLADALALLAVHAATGSASGAADDRPGAEADDAPPVGVRVAVTSRFLPGITVLDTPGVGGLRAVHGRRARAAVAQASVMVFVSDGGQVLTAPELAFVREVAAGSASVVFVLSRTDRNPTTWEQVLAENRALLTEHAPRLATAPIVAVAATYAVQARDYPPPTAAKLEEASGLPELARVLVEHVAGADAARVVHALEGCADGLERAAQGLARELAVLERADPATVDAMVGERERLAELRRDLRTSRLELERDLGRVRQAAVNVVNQGADDIVTRLGATISKQRLTMTKARKQQFAGELEAELAVLVAEVRRALDVGVQRVVADAFGSLEATTHGRVAVPVDVADLTSRIRMRPAATTSSMFDPSLATTAFMGVQVAALIGIAGPIGIVLAGGWVTLNIGFRGMREGQGQLSTMLNENVNVMRRELSTGVDAVVREIRPELYVALEDHLKACIAELDTLITQSEAQTARSVADQERARGEVRRRRDAVVAQHQHVLDELTTLRREGGALR